MNLFSLNVADFSLRYTLECGQVFRWDRIGENEYTGVVNQFILKIQQDKRRLFVYASSPKLSSAFIKSYLDLTLDLPYIYNKIGKDKHIKAAIERFRGLRITRQPVWECAASFIISAFNNIPRIRGIVYNISRCAGKPLNLDGYVNYSFPSPETVADSTVSQLEACGAGFRAPYLKKTARAILEGKLTAGMLKKMPYAEAKETLMRLDGIGQKVADCVLLYSVGRFEAFPVDVWIKRVMQNLYFKGRKISENKIRQFGQEYFGEYAGYAQQYLYHYARTNWKIPTSKSQITNKFQ